MTDFLEEIEEDELMDILGAEDRSRQGRQEASPEPESARYAPMVGDPLERLWERNQQPIDAVPTMLPKWNGLCGGRGGRIGLARGWNVVFAAPPGTMKSIFACNLAVAAAFHGEQVAFHSLEMDWDDVALRTVAIASETDIWKLEPGKGFSISHAREASRIMAMIREKAGGTIHANEEVVPNLKTLKDNIRRRYEVQGCRYQIVDYLQLVGIGSGRWDDILARVTETSFEVRMLTKELQITTVGLSQLHREAIRSKERPTAQDLMGGSPLENDAHQILIYDPTRFKRVPDGWTGWLAFVKNRHGDKGETADIPIHFNRNCLQVRERDHDEISADELEPAGAKPQGKRRNG